MELNKEVVVFSLLRENKSIQKAWMNGRKFKIFKAEFEQIRTKLGLQNWKKSRAKILKFDAEHATAQGAAHGANYGAPHEADHGANYGAPQEADHGAPHEADHGAPHEADHGALYGAYQEGYYENMTFSPCAPWIWDDERGISGISGISEIIMNESDDVHAMLLQNHDGFATDTNTGTGTGTGTDTDTDNVAGTDTSIGVFSYTDDSMMDNNNEYVLDGIDSMYEDVFDNSGEGVFDNSDEGIFDNSGEGVEENVSEENDIESFLNVIHNQQI